MKLLMTLVSILFLSQVFNVVHAKQANFIAPKLAEDGYVHPNIPKRLWRAKQEGWVILNFIVKEDGSVSDVIVTDSNGIEGYEEKAANTIAMWKYVPAQKNGKNISSVVHARFQNFNREGAHSEAVDDIFNLRYNKFFDALEKKDYAQAKSIIDKYTDYDKDATNFTESKLLEQMRASYYYLSGNAAARYEAVLRHFRHMRANGDDTKNVEEWRQIAAQVIVAGAESGNYAYAKEIYNWIFNSFDVKPESTAKAIERINSAMQSEEPLFLQTTFNHLGVKYHQVSRPYVVLLSDKPIAGVEIRCDMKQTRISVISGDLFNIPKGWGQCGLILSGEAKSEISIAELLTVPDA